MSQPVNPELAPRSSQHPPSVFSGNNNADPMQILHDFFKGYHLYEVKQMLWEWLVTAISKDHSIYDDAKERSSLFFFYEQMHALAEAAYFIHLEKAPPGSSDPKTKKYDSKKNEPAHKKS